MDRSRKFKVLGPEMRVLSSIRNLAVLRYGSSTHFQTEHNFLLIRGSTEGYVPNPDSVHDLFFLMMMIRLLRMMILMNVMRIWGERESEFLTLKERKERVRDRNITSGWSRSCVTRLRDVGVRGGWGERLVLSVGWEDEILVEVGDSHLVENSIHFFLKIEFISGKNSSSSLFFHQNK